MIALVASWHLASENCYETADSDPRPQPETDLFGHRRVSPTNRHGTIDHVQHKRFAQFSVGSNDRRAQQPTDDIVIAKGGQPVVGYLNPDRFAVT